MGKEPCAPPQEGPSWGRGRGTTGVKVRQGFHHPVGGTQALPGADQNTSRREKSASSPGLSDTESGRTREMGQDTASTTAHVYFCTFPGLLNKDSACYNQERHVCTRKKKNTTHLRDKERDTAAHTEDTISTVALAARTRHGEGSGHSCNTGQGGDVAGAGPGASPRSRQGTLACSAHSQAVRRAGAGTGRSAGRRDATGEGPEHHCHGRDTWAGIVDRRPCF